VPTACPEASRGSAACSRTRRRHWPKVIPYPDAAFDAVASFTMLHHVPTATTQYQILAEARRVLRPGGTLAGSDSLASVSLHHFHAGDTYNPLDPAMLLTWLRTLGFSPVTIIVGEVLMFTARKPAADEEPS
jgi:ubiquinone/menaquinone biosynthesis C-methylase UbiE